MHEVYRRWHRVLAEYPGDRMTVAEAWTQTPESMARFVRADEMSQAFNFSWLLAPWSATAFAKVIRSTLEAARRVGAAPTWVLSNHDVVRHATRYGGGAVGLARARASTLAMLALPGSAYLYQGEELGLEDVDVPPRLARTRPGSARSSGGTAAGCRSRGRARAAVRLRARRRPALAAAADRLGGPSVEAQEQDPDSTLAFYRAALAARREHARDAPRRSAAGCRRRPAGVPPGRGDRGAQRGVDAGRAADGRAVLASGPLEGRLLPADTAVWLGLRVSR